MNTTMMTTDSCYRGKSWQCQSLINNDYSNNLSSTFVTFWDIVMFMDMTRIKGIKCIIYLALTRQGCRKEPSKEEGVGTYESQTVCFYLFSNVMDAGVVWPSNLLSLRVWPRIGCYYFQYPWLIWIELDRS